MRKKKAEKILKKIGECGKILEFTLEEIQNMEIVRILSNGTIYRLKKKNCFYQIGVYHEGRIEVKRFEKMERH